METGYEIRNHFTLIVYFKLSQMHTVRQVRVKLPYDPAIISDLGPSSWLLDIAWLSEKEFRL